MSFNKGAKRLARARNEILVLLSIECPQFRSQTFKPRGMHWLSYKLLVSIVSMNVLAYGAGFGTSTKNAVIQSMSYDQSVLVLDP